MAGAAGRPDYAAWRFLIADDKAFIRFLVQGMLERLGAKDIVQAANGAHGRGLLEASRGGIDCVISDWNMHPVGGLELLRSVRAGEIAGVSRATCFIMLTGHAAEKVVRAAIALDVNAYLTKPVSFEKLTATVSSAMAVRFTPQPAELYAAVEGLEVPTALVAADSQPPPWLPEIADPPRRAVFEQHLRQIRSEMRLVDPAGDPIAIRNTRRRALDDISAGLVVAENIFAHDQAPLVPAGTVITPTLLADLRDLCGGAADDVELWVGDHGAAAPVAGLAGS